MNYKNDTGESMKKWFVIGGDMMALAENGSINKDDGLCVYSLCSLFEILGTVPTPNTDDSKDDLLKDEGLLSHLFINFFCVVYSYRYKGAQHQIECT